MQFEDRRDLNPGDRTNSPRSTGIQIFLMPANARKSISQELPAMAAEVARQKILAMARPRGWYGAKSRAIRVGACRAAVAFVDSVLREWPRLALPEISPSLRGGVTLAWRFGDVSLLVRTFSANGPVYFQQEGPNCRVQTGMEDRERVLQRLQSLIVHGAK
jgi:hypothetical protein